MTKSNFELLQVNPTLLNELIRKIQEELGLSFADKPADLEKALRNYFKEYRNDALESKLNELLQQDLTQNFTLIDQLTIPETYFFRNRKLFSILEKKVLPQLLKQKRSLTIWSAGCSSGEEAYSLAMLIDQIGRKQKLKSEVRILATDLNLLKLQQAQKGIYSKWSFRNMPEAFMRSYFTPFEERFFEIADHIRHMVHFQQHNLQSGPFPPAAHWASFDLIMCRNVLIYFDKPSMLKVLENFYQLLNEQGYFISGPAEIPSLHFKKFATQAIDNVIFYRKNSDQLNTPSLRTRQLKTSNHPLAKTKSKVQKPHFTSFPTASPPSPIEKLTIIKKLADNGQAREAKKRILDYLKNDHLNARAYYLLGTINLELGELEEAERNLQKTLFLEPDFIMAHFHLANLYSLSHRRNESKVHFNNVLKLINTWDAQQTVPQSEGLTVFQLRQMVEEILENCKLAS